MILVTGANGFIGSHVVERLLRDGRKVRGLVRASSDLTFLKGVDVELVRGDIVDRASLDDPMRGVEDAVHAAGFVSDWGSRDVCLSVNVHGTRNVIEAARAAGVRRLVHISTAALHGFPGARNQDESTPMPETSFAYCESKKQAEREVFASGLEATAIRPGNVFGPRDHTFIEKYAHALEQGRGGYIGGGRSWTCPAYVENLADAIALACFEPAAAGEAFLATDGLDIDWRT
ncbi:MAG TPA: NAD-dependent epimerase/dehydratase family protein, partial [Steroidobacteraceae bacterium]